MPFNDFAPYLKMNGCFVVRNIGPNQKKTIKIFQYPIEWGCTRDLLKIPGVDESNIRGSLLKGELNHKIRAKEIVVVCSDIDLLQFNENHKQFLQDAGIINGLEVSGGGQGVNYLFKEQILLSGVINGSNRIFTLPNSDKFLNGVFEGNLFKIFVTHNGHILFENIDYIVLESGGIGTGFDTIELKSFAPRVNSILYASYVIKKI